MKKLLFIALTIIFPSIIYAQPKMTTSSYIMLYKDIAMKNMSTSGIPASIIMAQAINESGSGNSPLSYKSNNHFGIKCKPEWTGDRVSHDDDAKGECFRKYDSVYDSYMDHSLFLTTRDRYSSLFDLDKTDYRGWAHGLKSAGYATNPNYPTMLINTIEEHKLYELDEQVLGLADNSGSKPAPVVDNSYQEDIEEEEKEVSIFSEDVYSGVKAVANDYNFKDTKLSTAVYINNNTDFIIAEEGDSFSSISNRTKKSIKKLVKYNELDGAPTSVTAGSIIYISKKRSKASNGYDFHRVAKGETLHYISQKYGIRIDKLASMNLYDTDYIIKPGQKMVLRTKQFLIF